jgi:hypothetical protein
MKLTIKELVGTSLDYAEEIEEYNLIKSLYKGDVDCYKTMLVPKRLEEKAIPYKQRLSQFVYTGIMAAAINEILTKFIQGNINVMGSTDVLTKVRGLIHKNSGEIMFLQKLLKHILLYEDVYVLITFSGEYVDGLEAQINSGYIPNLQIINRPQVLIYEEAEFAKIQTLKCKTSISGDVRYVYNWFVITNKVIEKFTYECNKEISKADWSISIEGEIIEHNLGCMPLFKFCSPRESLAEQLLPKQKQYTLIENGLNAAAYAANMIQKVYTPAAEDISVPINDVNVGNEYLLKASKFEFAEIKGTSLEVQMKLLDRIENDVKHIAALSGLSFNKGNNISSGYSKSFENKNLEASLEGWGKVVINIYTKLLNIISCNIYGSKTEVSIIGLDNFSQEAPEDLIKLLTDASKVKDELAPSAYKQLTKRVSESLIESATPEILEKINLELGLLE